MAAPTKQKLEYFSFDVDFFSDEKIEAISGEFGIKGEIVAVKLLCAIYRNGYFIEWSEMLKMKLLKNLPGVSKELLEQIVERLIKWGFFNETLFNSDKILTSTGIQKRFEEATKRRKNVDNSHYWLLNEVNVNINPDSNKVNDNNYSQSKKKVKESKVNQTIKKESKKTSRFTPPKLEEVFSYMLEKEVERKVAQKESEKLWHYYDAKGWMIGKNKMKNWKSAVTGWITRMNEYKPLSNGKSNSKAEPTINRQTADTIYQNSQGWEIE